MFSIIVEEIFEITGRKGIIFIGETSGVIKIGDFIIDNHDKSKKYKIIGLEMVRFSDKDKCLTHNPAIVIDADISKVIELKGKVLKSKYE